MEWPTEYARSDTVTPMVLIAAERSCAAFTLEGGTCPRHLSTCTVDMMVGSLSVGTIGDRSDRRSPVKVVAGVNIECFTTPGTDELTT